MIFVQDKEIIPINGARVLTSMIVTKKMMFVMGGPGQYSLAK